MRTGSVTGDIFLAFDWWVCEFDDFCDTVYSRLKKDISPVVIIKDGNEKSE